MRSIESSLWRLLVRYANNDEIYHYLKDKVEAYPPASPWGKRETELSEALGKVLKAEEQAAAQGKAATPRLMEMARMLRRKGAQLVYYNGHND